MLNQPSHWTPDVEVKIDSQTLQNRVIELGREITETYAKDTSLCVVGILKGCFMFYADLVRAIDLPVTCEFMGISSYGDATKSSGVVKITSDLTRSIEGRDVLIVEDIVDTGLTMHYLLENFQTRNPNSVRLCTLLNKPESHQKDIHVDFAGFSIGNEFVIGYGLDYAEKYRNLNFIGVYRGDT